MRRALLAARRGVALLCLATLALATVATAAMTQVAYTTDIRPPFGKDDGLLTILAIGSDMGMPLRAGNPLRGRSDGTHLIVVDTLAKRATIVDFPRDSFIGGDKVNAHMARGGPEALEAQLEAYTGIPIDYHAVTTFRGIEEMTRVLGGVDVVVERPMSDPFSGSNFVPGPQRLDGPQALAFLRDRKSLPDGDIGRARNHGNFMRAVHVQVRNRQADLPTLTWLSALFLRNTVTNIPKDQILPLAMLATQIPPEQVYQVGLTGSFGTASNGGSIIHLGPGNTFERIRAGQVGPP